MALSLVNDCVLSGTLSFTIPAVYLAANPGGSVTVMLTAGSSILSTVIAYPRPFRAFAIMQTYR